MKRIDRVIIFDPKPGATPDEIMEVLKLFVFQTYPPEVRTRENMMALFDKLSDGAKRHFRIENRT